MYSMNQVQITEIISTSWSKYQLYSSLLLHYVQLLIAKTFDKNPKLRWRFQEVAADDDTRNNIANFA